MSEIMEEIKKLLSYKEKQIENLRQNINKF